MPRTLMLFPSPDFFGEGAALHRVADHVRYESCDRVLVVRFLDDPPNSDLCFALREESGVQTETVDLPVSSSSRPDQILDALDAAMEPDTGAVLLLDHPSPGLLMAVQSLAARYGGLELDVLHAGKCIAYRPPAADPSAVREPSAVYGASGSVRRDPVQRAGIVAESDAMRKVLDAATVLAGHQVPVLIQGETGTGKSLLARYLHLAGPRFDRPHPALNCAALPEKLVESILFGHRRGAFTGAVDHQTGVFEEADGGTLFLDEIGELTPEVQAKLLRVLEDGWIQALGAPEGRQVDVRILAATNRDLQRDVHEGRFREDLYHRLSFGVIRLPALRDRPEDIPALARRFLERFNRSLARPRELSEEALHYLEAQAWPGNVRELEHTVGRAAMFAPDRILGPRDFTAVTEPVAFTPTSDPVALGAGFSLEQHLRDTRQRLIEQALTQTGGNQSAAARLLGVSPQAVSKYIRSSS